MQKGFSMVEMTLVMGIIALGAVFVLFMWRNPQRSYYSIAVAELEKIAEAAHLMMLDQDGRYPADVARGMPPPGIEAYLGQDMWPTPPWDGSTYDWDHWTIGEEEIVQVSIRFCPPDQPSACRIPDEAWAAGFDYWSAVYYCIEGSCRSHSARPKGYPGYCVNC